MNNCLSQFASEYFGFASKERIKMSDSETDTEPCIFILSDTDEHSDDSDADTVIIRTPEKDAETEVEEKNVSVPNKNKNQNTVPKKSSASSRKRCKICNRSYSSPASLERHIMAIHTRPIFVECPVSSCKKMIKSIWLNEHLRRTHNNNFNKSHGQKSTPEIGVRKSTRVPIQIIKNETSVADAPRAICQNHQITCEECNHRIILPKGIQLAHDRCMNSTPSRIDTSMHRSGSKTKTKRSRFSGPHSTPTLASGLVITTKEIKCCPACKVKFPNDRIAIDHYLKLHNRNVVPCTCCDKYFSSNYKLRAHFDNYHKN